MRGQRRGLVQMSDILREDGTGTGVAVAAVDGQTATVVVGTEADVCWAGLAGV